MGTSASLETKYLKTLDDLFFAVARRRVEQDERFGGPRHDDTHTRQEWADLIVAHTQAAVDAAYYPAFEPEMFDVAGLALAAIASARRKASE